MKAGFIKFGTDHEKHCLVGHPLSAAVGKGTNPIHWNRVWNKTAGYLIESNLVQPKGVTRIMVKIYMLLGRLLSPFI
jgi:hypothetical protein